MEEEAEDAWDRQRSAAIERLEQAEKVAERIVSKNIPEAVQKVRTVSAKSLQLLSLTNLEWFGDRAHICTGGHECCPGVHAKDMPGVAYFKRGG